MVPARNLLYRDYDSYGGWFDESLFDFHREKPCVRSNPMMAEEDSWTGDEKEEAEAEEGEVGTSAKDTDDWLRLGIGRSSGSQVDPSTSCANRAGRLMELELFSDKPSSSSLSLPRPPPSLPVAATMGVIPPMMPVFPTHGVGYRRDMPWGGFLNPNPVNASASTAVTPLQYSFRRFLCPPGSSWASAGEGGGGPGGMRVVRPARRPETGVWFMLQAAQNQVREPFLPQIPKSYMRIKDGRMTVRLLMKYLVNKLGLDDELEIGLTPFHLEDLWDEDDYVLVKFHIDQRSEEKLTAVLLHNLQMVDHPMVEVSCRGQPLLPFLTLQHVRDSIWRLRAAAAEMELLPDSPPTDHVMTLQYGRSSSSSST